jgi:triosephosphate isomerase
MREQIAAANWKMNLTVLQAEALLNNLLQQPQQLSEHQKVIFAVPFPYLSLAQKKVAGLKNYFVAAQNCSDKKQGAYTGETSAEMLQSLGIQYVVLGHSERREYFLETDKIVADKIDMALSYGITPIFCCGEQQAIREEKIHHRFVEGQIINSLFHLSAAQIKKIIIAYEPIWAIGTGKTATALEAQDMHQHLRKTLLHKYGKEIADSVPVLYGGSVKGSNAKEIFLMPDVDGGLVGGASLIAEDFKQIIAALK